MTDPATLMEEQQVALADTDLCQQATQFVPYRGSDDPRILFIGEAPGKHEDEQGKPFVGRAGDLLDEWIEGLGLTADEYAITNLVKCRPPENRAPTGEEAQRFGTWLEKEIDVFDPAIIVPLGSSATAYLLPDTRQEPFLDAVCYTEHRYEERTVIPLPHPAYGLRQGGMDLDYDRLTPLFEGDTDR